MTHTPFAGRYVAAYYYGFTIMSTVGFGDISAHRTSERMLTIVMMLVGCFNFGSCSDPCSDIIRVN